MTDLLDMAVLQELREIMEDDFDGLLETFLSESARQYAEANQAWSIQDFDQLRRAAHSLKGSCGNVGAQGLKETCEHLEYSARDRADSTIPELLAVAEIQLEEVCTAIRALH